LTISGRASEDVKDDEREEVLAGEARAMDEPRTREGEDGGGEMRESRKKARRRAAGAPRRNDPVKINLSMSG